MQNTPQETPAVKARSIGFSAPGRKVQAPPLPREIEQYPQYLMMYEQFLLMQRRVADTERMLGLRDPAVKVEVLSTPVSIDGRPAIALSAVKVSERGSANDGYAKSVASVAPPRTRKPKTSRVPPPAPAQAPPVTMPQRIFIPAREAAQALDAREMFDDDELVGIARTHVLIPTAAIQAARPEPSGLGVEYVPSGSLASHFAPTPVPPTPSPAPQPSAVGPQGSRAAKKRSRKAKARVQAVKPVPLEDQLKEVKTKVALARNTRQLSKLLGKKAEESVWRGNAQPGFQKPAKGRKRGPSYFRRQVRRAAARIGAGSVAL